MEVVWRRRDDWVRRGNEWKGERNIFLLPLNTVRVYLKKRLRK